MKKTVSVITGDSFLFQKIYLILKPHANLSQDVGAGDICLWDADSMPMPERTEGVYRLSRGGGDITIPFDSEGLLRLVMGTAEKAQLRLGDSCVYLRGEKIKLTDLEFSLLNLLMSEGGGFVCREKIVQSVWGEGVDGGVLNVYVHYLREKLERAGEKIILSSRKLGYRIDEKYLISKEEE